MLHVRTFCASCVWRDTAAALESACTDKDAQMEGKCVTFTYLSVHSLQVGGSCAMRS